jgi:TPR repeat protein
MRTTRTISFAALLFLLSTTASPADLPTAQAAYDTGDYATALSNWQQLADEGFVEAQFGLGLLYANGFGVPMNDDLALKWYKSAAEQGHAQAQCNLGVMYANGWGVPQSDQDALGWYLLAAEQGLTQAQIAVANLYFSGHRIEGDKVEARKWLAIAARLGDLSAPAKRDSVDAYLSEDEIMRSDAMAISWVDTHQALLATVSEDD